MIERWFPCAEVSEAAERGWGTGNSEKMLFTWFAARPLAQAKAAVIASLLPWPDDPGEQARLQELVRRSLTERDAAHTELVDELARLYPDGISIIDPFSGRGMIPLEAARLGIKAWGIDYSPVATLGGQLLADYPLRDWSKEPDLPFDGYFNNAASSRLLQDVEACLNEVENRWAARMSSVYPRHEEKQPWGYLWAVTLPCQECNRRFPLVGSLVLRHPLPKRGDPGQWFSVDASEEDGTCFVSLHEGSPDVQPTRVLPPGQSKHSSKGKVGVCPFQSCQHVHRKDVLERLASDGLGEDALLIVGDLDPDVGKSFRLPSSDECAAVEVAGKELFAESPFAPGLSAKPDEPIPPGNTWTVQPSLYGARTYGDLCNARQTLSFIRLARVISEIGDELQGAGCSHEYTECLTGYAASVLQRRLRLSTRGAPLKKRRPGASNRVYVSDIFGNSESSIAFSYDYFEVGIGDGPGSLRSLGRDTLAVLRNQVGRLGGQPAIVQQGTALHLPLGGESVEAVVTDPPYDDMIDYSDASDLFYVWLKRALVNTRPELGLAAAPSGLQPKDDEIVVKKGGSSSNDHRTRAHYDRLLAESLVEANRVVKSDGVVTIVFGHGDPEVWHRLLQAIETGGLYLTGSWPARTESGGAVGSANIVTTLTMSCRPVAPNRPVGRANDVRVEIRGEITERVPMWERAGLALTDQLMASAGPAMEIVGKYTEVLDPAGNRVEPFEFLAFARRAVEEVAAIKVEDVPLEGFDSRSRFALFWARLYGRGMAPKSEARWQAMASDLTLDDLKGLLKDTKGGTRLATASEATTNVSSTSSVIDVALAAAAAWQDGLDAVAEVFAASGRDSGDSQLFAAITYLSSRLPEADDDRQAWNGIVRNRRGLSVAAKVVTEAVTAEALRDRQGNLFELDESELS